jgi:benzoate-CoA ligase
MQLSSADHTASPPAVHIPRAYNPAHDLLARNAGRPAKPAFINAGNGEALTCGEIDRQVHQFANAFRSRGFAPESRLLTAMLDTPHQEFCSRPDAGICSGCFKHKQFNPQSRVLH